MKKAFSTIILITALTLLLSSCGGTTRPRQGAKSIDDLDYTDWTWNDDGTLNTCPPIAGFDQDGDCIPDAYDPDPSTPNDWREVCHQKYPTMKPEQAEQLCTNDYLQALSNDTGLSPEELALLAAAPNLGQILMGSVALLGALGGLAKKVFGPAAGWVVDQFRGDDEQASRDNNDSTSTDNDLPAVTILPEGDGNFDLNVYGTVAFVGPHTFKYIIDDKTCDGTITFGDDKITDDPNASGGITKILPNKINDDCKEAFSDFSLMNLAYAIPKESEYKNDMFLIPENYNLQEHNWKPPKSAGIFSIKVDKHHCFPIGGRGSKKDGEDVAYDSYNTFVSGEKNACKTHFGTAYECNLRNDPTKDQPLQQGVIQEATLLGKQTTDSGKIIKIKLTRVEKVETTLLDKPSESAIPFCFSSDGSDYKDNVIYLGTKTDATGESNKGLKTALEIKKEGKGPEKVEKPQTPCAPTIVYARHESQCPENYEAIPEEIPSQIFPGTTFTRYKCELGCPEEE